MTDTSSNTPRIVVGVDGSPGSKVALRWAARIAKTENAVLDVVGAWEFPPSSAWAALPDNYDPHAEMEKVVTETVDEVFGADRPVGLTVHTAKGHSAAVLLQASQDALMLVVGSRGHGGFMGLLLGSVSANVAEHATCPVLVVHDKTKPADTQEATS